MITFTIKYADSSDPDILSGSQSTVKDVSWEVRETLRPRETYQQADLQVLSVVADGRELDLIYSEFNHLPSRRLNLRHGIDANVWRGELARFIWDNL